MAAALSRRAGLRFTARGASMHPFIADGDVVTVSPIAGRRVVCGDIVACRTGDGVVVHRLVGRTGGRFIVRGDNCESCDGLADVDMVLGRVTAVERHGRPMRLAVGPAGRLLAVLSRRGWLRPLVSLRAP